MGEEAKDAVKYKAAIQRVQAILKSESLKLPTKVAGGDVEELVKELFAEENETIFKKFKEDLRILLKKHIEMNKEIAKKRKEFEELEIAKQKEFISAANALFEGIDGLGELEEAYAKSLEKILEQEPK